AEREAAIATADSPADRHGLIFLVSDADLERRSRYRSTLYVHHTPRRRPRLGLPGAAGGRSSRRADEGESGNEQTDHNRQAHGAEDTHARVVDTAGAPRTIQFSTLAR